MSEVLKPRNMFKNNQAFWLMEEGEFILVPHVRTLEQFANYLIKNGMEQENLRFITKEKKRYIEMWSMWCKTQPNCDEDNIIDMVASEIMDSHIILHRKSYVHENMPPKPLNSRYKQRVKYRLKKTIESIINT